ncbi:hypothetical protein CEXT_328401 [Caerostris extrusa]|uniref:Uncharacterized protein n=1 Tax=Caerostris extrusa TaxID=172846 RepID=A0AAV4U272_CAEEX|nr:hypothetical protein CEXT_328401 [Caerostris extrusa]
MSQQNSHYFIHIQAKRLTPIYSSPPPPPVVNKNALHQICNHGLSITQYPVWNNYSPQRNKMRHCNIPAQKDQLRESLLQESVRFLWGLTALLETEEEKRVEKNVDRHFLFTAGSAALSPPMKLNHDRFPMNRWDTAITRGGNRISHSDQIFGEVPPYQILHNQ